MMQDLISRQAAIDEAYAVIVDDAVYDVVQVETLEGLPSVDAVEIVHCKDCYHYDEEHSRCLLNDSDFEPEDFCSYGSK